MKTLRILITILCIAAISACSKDNDGDDPAIIGTWVSTAVEGTVSYPGWQNLSNLVNNNLSNFNSQGYLTGILTFVFDAKGNTQLIYEGGSQSGTYSFKNNSLYMKESSSGESMTMQVTISGSNMKMKLNPGDGYAEAIAYALGDVVLKQNGTSMATVGISMESITTNLTLVLKKQ